MFALALLAGVAVASPKVVAALPLRTVCPGSAPVSPFARTCSALDVSGSTAPGSLRLDPAFDVAVAPAQLSRPAASEATLTGYAADGRTVFTFPVAASGFFQAYVPLAPALAQSVQRLQLVAPAGVTERSATTHGAPDGEMIAVDEAHVLFAWDARAFPAVRIATAPGALPIVYVSGAGTYAQLTVASNARRLFVDFSDGVRSATRVFRVFGR